MPKWLAPKCTPRCLSVTIGPGVLNIDSHPFRGAYELVLKNERAVDEIKRRSDPNYVRDRFTFRVPFASYSFK